MSRSLHKLNDTSIRSSKLKPGKHGDGGGLWLKVSESGHKAWKFFYTRGSRRSELTLGAYPAVSLSRARELATEARVTLERGEDPKHYRKGRKAMTFGDAADEYIKVQKDGWRNPKHAAQWTMTLGDTYCRKLRKLPVSEVSTDDVLAVLKPIWTKKAETATRLRGRIERVLAFGKVKKWRSGDNPAAWRGHLSESLPKRIKLQRGHHAAMPWAEVPAFMRDLRDVDTIAARALEFTIFTAARSGEVFGARWSEIDMIAKVWTVPAERMKAGREHRVPLTDAAFRIIQRLHNQRLDDGFVFPGRKDGRPMSIMAMAMILRRKEITATVHGFRSSFRDWAGDATAHPREVAEAALAHVIGSATEQAYRRSDAFEKRRALMNDWAAFLEAPSKAKESGKALAVEREAA